MYNMVYICIYLDHDHNSIRTITKPCVKVSDLGAGPTLVLP